MQGLGLRSGSAMQGLGLGSTMQPPAHVAGLTYDDGGCGHPIEHVSEGQLGQTYLRQVGLGSTTGIGVGIGVGIRGRDRGRDRVQACTEKTYYAGRVDMGLPT